MRRFYHGQNKISLSRHTCFRFVRDQVKTVFCIIIIGSSEADTVSASLINFYDERNSGNYCAPLSSNENILIQIEIFRFLETQNSRNIFFFFFENHKARFEVKNYENSNQNSNFFTFFEKFQDIVLWKFLNSNSVISNNFFFFFTCKKLRFENLNLFEFLKNFEINFSNFFSIQVRN